MRTKPKNLLPRCLRTKPKNLLSKSLLRSLRSSAVAELKGQAEERRDQALNDPEARSLLSNDARRLDAVARALKATNRSRLRVLLGKTDSAVLDLMPALPLNLAGFCTNVKARRGEPCYCPDCADWAI